MTRLRNYFLTGLLVAGPAGITIYITWSMVSWIDSWVKPYLPLAYNPDTYLPFRVPGYGLVVALIVITLIGFLTANIVGASIFSFSEELVDRMHTRREREVGTGYGKSSGYGGGTSYTRAWRPGMFTFR